MSDQQPWLTIREACKFFGITFESAKNAILQNRFPVPTYKLGRTHVVDRDVMDRYFKENRMKGMARMDDPPPPRPDGRRNNKGRKKKGVSEETPCESPPV